jgi:hypothetical protein
MLVRSSNPVFQTVVFEEVAGSTAYIFILRNGERRKFAEKDGKAISPDEIPADYWIQLEESLGLKSANC